MRERRQELEALGVRVFAVSFESQERIEAFQQKKRLPFRLLRDPQRAAYRAFGLGRKPLTTVWGPETAWYYVRRLLQGRLPERRKGDPYQLGGDVILGSDLSGGWIYASANPADRPEVGALLRLLRGR